jgi:hypothetical protein
LFSLPACVLILSLSCASASIQQQVQPNSLYYRDLPKDAKDRVKDLFKLLQESGQTDEVRFTIVRETANELFSQNEFGKLTHFLSREIEAKPENPYNAWLLLMIAWAHLEQNAEPVAALYFDRIVKNYPDLMVKGESVHHACLTRLIELSDNPEQLVWYYQELISRFPDRIDIGTAHFMLAQAQEKTGEWDLAIRAYTRFLPYHESSIVGFPNAYNYAKNLVDFSRSSKDWTYESLGSLVGAVKSALSRGSVAAVRQLRAKVNFFSMSWEQEESSSYSQVDFNFSDFMIGNRIRYATELDSASNANEAYLRTWGWSQRISTWYLYFRKIYFPADPEIHGRWEWAGIYYGEKF